MSDLVLVRHGETVGQSSIRLYGSTNVELSGLGRSQMVCVRDALHHIPFKSVVTSPLCRAYESAEIIIGGNGNQPRVVSEFREIDFGNWEGMTFEEIARNDPEGFAMYQKNAPLSIFPGGESKKHFFERIQLSASTLFPSLEPPVLAVLHKGVIKVILSTLLNIPLEEGLKLPVELGSIHYLERLPSVWRLTCSNETAHLGQHRIENS